MPTIQQFKSETEGVRNVATQPRLLAIPPNFFAITMGLAGLAGVWRLAGDLYHLPASIGDALYVVTAVGFLPLVVPFSLKLCLPPQPATAEYTPPLPWPLFSQSPLRRCVLCA